jgi:Leucine-rich repeat (LRR) protein
LRPSLIIVGVLLTGAAIAVKNGWQERFFAPTVHAVRAAGGHVQFEHKAPEWAQALFGPDCAAQMESVSLPGTALSDQELGRLLRRLPQISNLYLNNSRLADSGGASLASFTGLVTLSLAQTAITDATLQNLSGCAFLNYLDLAGTQVDGSGLPALAKLPNLQAILLSRCPVTDTALAELAAFPRLTNLYLSDCPEISDGVLAHLGQVRGLSILDLRKTRITGSGLKFLGRLAALNQLNLAGTPLEDDMLQGIASWSAARLNLNLSGSGITNRGLPHVQGIIGLVNLDLSGTAITDEAANVLAGMTGLQSLRLDDTAVTDRTLAALAKLPKLWSLSLRNTKITDDGMQLLVANPMLCGVNVLGTAVSRSFVAGLERSRPTLSIVTDR